MRKKILVTGGLGFIGSNFIEQALDKNYEIICLDSCTYAANKELNVKLRKNKKYIFYKSNIGNEKKVKKILTKYNFDYIINFAAETHVDNSIKNPKTFFKSNVLELVNFLESIRKFNRNKKIKIFHISTDEVYGDLKYNDPAFKETNKYFPNSPYSSSKASSDMICRAWYKTFELPIIITNCTNNFGKYQNQEKLIPKIIKNSLLKKKIPIYGNGKNLREWIDVKDHCSAIFFLMKKGKTGQSYNIGSGKIIDNLSLAKKICNLINTIKNDKFDRKQLIKFVKDRKAHDFKYKVNCFKIKKLGWKCKKNFNKSLKKLIVESII